MTVLPILPAIAAFKVIPHVAASEAGRLAVCPLRFVFDHDVALRRLQAYAAAAVVGTAAHSAVAALIRSQGSRVLSSHETSTRAVARRAFDQALTLECRRRDAVIAERGELPGDSTEEPSALPFYGMTRARLARFAEQRFGESWLWSEPSFPERGSRQALDGGGRALRAVEAELRIRSSDGLVRGVADAVDGRDGKVVIEELKSGEITPERLESWRHQLLIYAQLYREQFGRVPDLLRVHSLPSGTHEFPCAPDEAEDAVAQARAALQDVNARIDAGVVASELAQPSQAACPHCPHRPWCEPYWEASAPGSNGADVEGSVVSSDGWEADLELSTGRTVRVDFKAVRVAPNAGSRLRICGSSVRRGRLATVRARRIRVEGPRVTAVPFAVARLPQAYRDWNSLLADELFPRGRAGVPVYLAVHDGLLNECGARRGLGRRDDFVRAVLGLSTAPARLFVRLEQAAEFWSENGRSREPPIIAGLAFAVLAAGEMATDGDATQANYYFRLNALMGVENQGKPEQFECTPDLWRMLRAWLRQERRGELVVHGLDSQHRFVDPVQSQCLVRSCDLEELAPVIRAAKRSAGQFPEPAEVVPALRAWLLRGGAHSRLARLLGRDPDEGSLSQAAEALCNGIEGAALDQLVTAEETRAAKTERATVAVRPSKYPNMTWKRAKWLLRIAASGDAEEAECLALIGNQVAIGKLDVREPPCYDIEIASDDAARLLRGEVIVTDENGEDVTPPPANVLWFQDGALRGRPGSWRLVPAPSAGIEHTVVSTSADSAGRITDALERPPTQVTSDHWPGPGIHAASSAIPRAGAILPGNVVVSSRAPSLRLNGGLRIRRGIYLRGGLPQPEAAEGAELRVQREGEAEPFVVVQVGAFVSLDLPEGQYALECEGAAADLFVLEPRWRECIVTPFQPSLDRSMRSALRHGQMRGAVLDVEQPSYAAYFRPGTRYRLYAPTVMKGSAPPNTGVHEYLSSHSIRHVTIMGRVAAAGSLPPAACFGETSGTSEESSGQDRNNMNRLLEYMSARSTGSVDAVRTYCAGIAGDGAWHRSLSALEDLGHVDVSWEDGRSWAVAPPAAVSRADQKDVSVLTGARSRQTIDWLGRHGVEAFADPRTADSNREPMPECIVVSTEGLARAADALGEIRLRLLPESPSQQLALQARPIAELEWWTGAPFTPPVARIQQTLQQWDARQLRWFTSADVARPGLYRWRENGRRVHYLVAGDSGVSVRDPAAAKWLLAPGDAGYLRYEAGARRLLVPSAMELPRIWKRICTIASGLAPLRLGRLLIYEHIPLDLARAAALRLNQPRAEGIL